MGGWYPSQQCKQAAVVVTAAWATASMPFLSGPADGARPGTVTQSEHWSPLLAPLPVWAGQGRTGGLVATHALTNDQSGGCSIALWKFLEGSSAGPGCPCVPWSERGDTQGRN